MKKDKYDLIVEEDISLFQYLFGTIIKIEHINGDKLEINLSKLDKKNNLYNQRFLIVKEKGLLIIDNNIILGRGNLFIKFNLVFPDNILEYKTDIKKIFNNINEYKCK